MAPVVSGLHEDSGLMLVEGPDVEWRSPAPLDPRLPVVLALVHGVDTIVRLHENGDLPASHMAPAMLDLVASALEGLGAGALAVEALRRFAEIDGTAPAREAQRADPLPDAMSVMAHAAADITFAVMSGDPVDIAAQRVARRFITQGQDDLIAAAGDDHRAFRRLIAWRQQMLAGRFGAGVQELYRARLQALKAEAGLGSRLA